MQGIDKRSGKRFNYIPDAAPHTYSDIADIQAVFRITPKYKERRFSFTILGKEYLLRLTSKA